MKDADEILVLDRGRVVERGDHRGLLAHGGWYARMYRRQLLEAEWARRRDRPDMTQLSAMAAEDDIFGKAYDRRLTARLLRYLVPYRRWVALSVLLLLVLSLAAVAPAIIVKLVIDDAITPAVNHQISPDEGLSRLAPLAALYLAVVVGRGLIRYVQGLLVTFVGQSAMRDLRVSLFAHVEHLSLSFFDRNPVGRLMTRLTNDVDALTAMVTDGVVSLLGDVLLLSGAIVVLFLLDARLALLTLCSLPVVILLASFFRVRMRQSFLRVPRPHRPDQRLPQRAPVRHDDRAALHGRDAELPPFRCPQRGSPARTRTRSVRAQRSRR